MHIKHERRMALAMSAALQSDVASARHGCVVFGERNKVLSSACNRQIPMVKQHKHFYTLHAEEMALMQLRRSDRQKARHIYVVRLKGGGNNKLANTCAFSRPCDRCQRRICETLKIPVYYST